MQIDGERFAVDFSVGCEWQPVDAHDLRRDHVRGQHPRQGGYPCEGIVRFDSIGTQQWEIASNDAVLRVLTSLTSA